MDIPLLTTKLYTPPPCTRVAWVSLDEGDNDPARLLTYLVAALQQVEAGLSQGIPNALRSPQRSPIKALLISLTRRLLEHLEAADLPFGILLSC